MSMLDWYVEIEYRQLLSETDKALLIELQDGREEWIPLSLIDDHDHEACTFDLVAWKANELDLLSEEEIGDPKDDQ